MNKSLHPSVHLARIESQADCSIEQAVRGLVESAGGLGGIVRPGSKVLLKPDIANVTSADNRTSLDIITTIGQMVQACGGEVMIGDSSILPLDSIDDFWEINGLNEIAREYDFTLISMERAGAEPIAVDTRVYYISRAALTADVIINLPRLRKDRWVGIAGAISNMFGIVPGFQKGRLLARDFTRREIAKLLVDVYASAAPDLNIIDALDHGQGAGSPEGIIGLSSDGVALDRVIASIYGVEPDSDSVIALASDAGLGIGWLEAIRVHGESAGRDEIGRLPDGSFSRLPAGLMNLAAPLVSVRATVESSNCDRCGLCVSVCPTRALELDSDNRLPRLNKPLCVRCWSCQASCPSQAIRLEPSYLAGTFFRS